MNRGKECVKKISRFRNDFETTFRLTPGIFNSWDQNRVAGSDWVWIENVMWDVEWILDAGTRCWHSMLACRESYSVAAIILRVKIRIYQKNNDISIYHTSRGTFVFYLTSVPKHMPRCGRGAGRKFVVLMVWARGWACKMCQGIKKKMKEEHIWWWNEVQALRKDLKDKG
jgi:hypothetical protein